MDNASAFSLEDSISIDSDSTIDDTEDEILIVEGTEDDLN